MFIKKNTFKNKTFSVLTLLLISATLSFSQTPINPPAVSGAPAVGIAPGGWSILQPSPDIINGNGPWPGGFYTVQDVDGVSCSGGAMSLCLSSANGIGESLQTTLTGLTNAATYVVSVEWQQCTLAGPPNYAAGTMSMSVGAGPQTVFTSTGTVSDGWQTASITFVAVGTTAVLRVGKTVQSFDGAIVFDAGVTCVLCNTSTLVAPALSTTSINVCGPLTANLNTITCNNTAPGTTLSIHSATPVALTNTVTNPTTASGGTYYAVFSNGPGCFGPTTAIVVASDSYTPSILNTSITCNGQANGTATVNPNGGVSPYTYTWTTNPLQNAVSATAMVPGTYSCLVQDAVGCVFSATTQISEPAALTLAINTNVNSVCAGNPINLSTNAAGGIGALNYAWSNGSAISTATVNETNSGTYTYTAIVTDANTCSVSAVQTLTFIPNPVLTSASKEVCYGQPANLSVNGATNYSWTPSSGLNVTSGSAVVANPSVTTVYSIVGNNSFCTAIITVTVGVTPYPNSVISCPNQQICEGQSTSISATGAQNYIWSPNYAISSTNAAAVTVAPLVNTTYTLTSYNTSGTVICAETKLMPIVVVPQVTVNISNPKIMCAGEKVNLTATGGNVIAWTPTLGLNQTNVSGVVASPTISTIYTASVSNNGFCGNSATVSVIVNPNPVVFAGRDTTYNLDEAMFINATGTGTLTWIDGEGVFCAVCPNTKIAATHSGCYVVETVNQFGCKAKDEMCVEITNNSGVFIPNTFTPNGDGLNDVFLVFGYSITDVTMEIFDRWGEKLFSSNDQKTGWNGTHKGLTCKNDVYVYKISYKGLDGKKQLKTGHVTIAK